MKTKFKTIALLLLVSLNFGIVSGCARNSTEESAPAETAQSETPAPSPSKTPEPESEEPSEEPEPASSEPDYIILGKEEAKSETAVLENKTAKTIIGVSVKLSDEDEFGENLLPENTEFKNGEFAKLFLEPLKFNTEENVENPRSDAEENENGITEDDVEFNEYYDIKLTFDDEKEYVIYDFSFDNISEAEIMFSTSDDVCYLKYESKITGELVNTLEAQKAMQIAEDNDKEVKDKSSKSSAKNTTNIPEPVKEPVWDEPAPAAPEAASVPEPPAPDQYVDDCLEENIEFFD